MRRLIMSSSDQISKNNKSNSKPPQGRAWWPLWPQTTKLPPPPTPQKKQPAKTKPKSPMLVPHTVATPSPPPRSSGRKKTNGTDNTNSTQPQTEVDTNGIEPPPSPPPLPSSLLLAQLQQSSSSSPSTAQTDKPQQQKQQQQEEEEPVTPHYAGIFLNFDSTQRLLRFYPPHHAQIHCHHTTLAYKPTTDQCLASFPLGTDVTMYVLGGCADDYGQCVEVSLPSWVPFKNEGNVPHVTVSVVPEVVGGASYSNELLAKVSKRKGGGKGVQPLKGLHVLHGVIGVYLTSGEIVYSSQELLQAVGHTGNGCSTTTTDSNVNSSGSGPTTTTSTVAADRNIGVGVVEQQVVVDDEDTSCFEESYELAQLLDALHVAEQKNHTAESSSSAVTYSTSTTENTGNRGKQSNGNTPSKQQQQQQRKKGNSKSKTSPSPNTISSITSSTSTPPVNKQQQQKQQTTDLELGVDLASLVTTCLPSIPPSPPIQPPIPTTTATITSTTTASSILLPPQLQYKHNTTTTSNSRPAPAQHTTTPTKQSIQEQLAAQFPTLNSVVITSALHMYDYTRQSAASWLQQIVASQQQQHQQDNKNEVKALADHPQQREMDKKTVIKVMKKEKQDTHNSSTTATTATATATPYYGQVPTTSTTAVTHEATTSSTTTTDTNTASSSSSSSSSTAAFTYHHHQHHHQEQQHQQQQPTEYTLTSSQTTNTLILSQRAERERDIMRQHQTAYHTHYKAAKAALHTGDKQSARRETETAKWHLQQAAAAKRRASANAFHARNSANLQQFTVDLHGMHVEEAIEVLERHIIGLSQLQHPGGVLLRIITGIGRNSEGGIPRLLPAVAKALGDMRIMFDTEENNPGVVRALL